MTSPDASPRLRSPTPAARSWRGARGRGLAWALLGAAVALPLLLTAAAAWLAWRQARQEATVELGRSADAAAEYARRILDGLILRADRANDLLAGLSDAAIRAQEPALHAELRRLGEAISLGDGRAPYLFVYDRDARPLVAGNVLPADTGASYADREFNQALRDATEDDVHVSPIYVGRMTGEPFFSVTKRRTRTGNPGLPPGAYDGVVNASMYVAEANEALRHLAGRPDDVISLVRKDGAMLARSAGLGPAGPAARLREGSPLLAAMRRGEERAVNIGPSSLDGVPRIAAYRRVPGFPLYVSAARAEASVAAAWRATAAAQLGVGLPAALLVLILARLVLRRQAELRDANAVLERQVAERTAELAASEALLRQAQRVARVGAFDVELPGFASRRSAGYMALHGGPAMPKLESHADWVARLHPEDRERAERHFLDAIADAGRETDYAQEYRIVTPDGATRWIMARAEIRRDPLSGRTRRVIGAHVDVTELKAAQAAVAESEARLRAALRGARLGTWERHLPSGAASWDARAAEIYGGLTVERCGPDLAAWRARVHPEDRAARLAAIEGAVAPGGSDSYDAEFRFRRDDGGWNWVAIHGSVVERDPATGRGLRLAGVARDVTQRREAEAALREREAWLRMAQEAGGIGTWELDPETGQRRWSEASYRIWGLEPGTPVTLERLLPLIHAADQARVEEAIAWGRTLPRGRLPEIAFRIRRASDGVERWLVSWGEVIPRADGQGQGRQLGVILDLTDRRRTEAALRTSEERLRQAQEAGGIGSWDWDMETGVLHWSESCHRLFGTDPAIAPSIERWRVGLHPADRAMAETTLDGAIADPEAQGFEMEYRYRRISDGVLCWIAVRGRIQRDPASRRARRLLGVALDITERKAAEERQSLLAREVDHRAKNALAVVQAAIRLTPRDDAAGFAQAIEGRVRALARAHTLLAEGRWSGTDLRLLAEGELAPFLHPPMRGAAPDPAGGMAPGTAQVVLLGPPVHLGPAAAQGLSMALHELATNATKHGALSSPSGKVHLEWEVDEAAGMLRLRWEERNGPPVPVPPTRRGFGSRVVEATVADQLGGTVERAWECGGLICTMTLPLDRLDQG